jgi:hypothetical protein
LAEAHATCRVGEEAAVLTSGTELRTYVADGAVRRRVEGKAGLEGDGEALGLARTCTAEETRRESCAAGWHARKQQRESEKGNRVAAVVGKQSRLGLQGFRDKVLKEEGSAWEPSHRCQGDV